MYFNEKAYDELFPERAKDLAIKATKSKPESVIETFEAKDSVDEGSPDASGGNDADE